MNIQAVIMVVWGNGPSAHTTEKWPIETSEIAILNVERMAH